MYTNSVELKFAYEKDESPCFSQKMLYAFKRAAFADSVLFAAKF